MQSGDVVLLACQEHLAALKEAGLHQPAGWAILPGEQMPTGEGRGTIRRLELSGGDRLVLKKMKRGGLAGKFRQDRFHGLHRLLANLTVPRELAGRGVLTAEPFGLLLQEGPRGMYQAWLATRELPGMVDLATWLAGNRPGSQERLDPVVRFVRSLHDAGLQHKDLNIGNLMVRTGPDGRAAQVAVIDLDGAMIHRSELPFRLRMAALWRLERSFVKRFGSPGVLGAGYRDRWAQVYAAEDRALTDRMLRWWRAGAALLAIRRAGWRVRE